MLSILYSLPNFGLILNFFVLLNTFNSVSDAAFEVLSTRRKANGILSCCKKQRKTAYGYNWKFVR